MKDFYYILGTDSNCTSAEIREAYIKLSKKFHPDLNEGDKYFESRFKEINEAYETLHDPDKRFRYDRNFKRFRLKDSPHQDSDQFDESQASPDGNAKTKVFGTVFTITLLVVGLIFAVYLIKWFNNSKKNRVAMDVVKNAPVLKIHKPHKITHELKSKPDADSLKPH